jgi:hypothetical protein
MGLRKWLGPILGLVILAAVGYAVKRSASDRAATTSRVTLRILSGSEKMALLKDERLAKVLERHGVALEVQKCGSREMPERPDLKSYDVAFPAGQPAAELIRRKTGAKASTTAFSTPMVIASWRPIAEVLAGVGVARSEGTVWSVDMARLLDLMVAGKRWRDLPGNTAFAVGKSVLVSTTSASTSNSAAQFLALASYLRNGGEVVASPERAERVALELQPLFGRQGYQEASSSGPFEDYLSIGMGKTPLVWIYEAQFLEQALRHGLQPEMVLLYPRPTLFTKHVMVPLSDQGARFVEAMADPAALAIAAEYGYRSEGLEALRGAARAKGLTLPDLVDLVDAPAFDLLERMIIAIENAKETAP